MGENSGAIVVAGREYEIPTDWRLGELRRFQQIAGVGLANLGSELQSGNADALAALVFLTMRRQNSQLTIEQVDDLEVESIRFDGPQPPAEEHEELSEVPPAAVAEDGSKSENGSATTAGL